MTISSDAEQATIKSGKLFIGDIQVPHVEGKKGFGGGYELFLGPQGRVASITLNDDEDFQTMAVFLAHAMAIAAGFTHFGPTSEVRNEYAPPSKR